MTHRRFIPLGAVAFIVADILGILTLRETEHHRMVKYAYYANGGLGVLMLLVAITLLLLFMFRRFGRTGGWGAVAVLVTLSSWMGWTIYSGYTSVDTGPFCGRNPITHRSEC